MHFHMWRIAFQICWLLALAGGLHATDFPLRFSQFTREAELPGQNVHALLEDAQGIMWIGTGRGLTRFDGARFIHLNPQDSIQAILRSAHILNLYASPDNRIWITTLGDGLGLYDPSRGTFSLFVHDPEISQSLPNNDVTDILMDRKGVIWVTTANGLAILDESSQAFKTYQHDAEDENSLPGNYLYDLTEAPGGDIWVSSSKGVSRIHRADTGYVFTRYVSPVIPNNSVWKIQADPHGGIWMSFVLDGVGRFDPFTKQCITYPAPDGVEEWFVNGLHLDDHGKLWMPLFREGLVAMDIQSGDYQYYKNDACNAQSLGGNLNFCVLQAQNGRWWAGHNAGISFFHPYDQVFNAQKIVAPNQTGQETDAWPQGLCVDEQGTTYLITSKGLFEKKPGRSEATFLVDPAKLREKEGAYPLRAVYKSRDGKIWMGTSFYGPIVYDPATGTSRSIYHRMGNLTDFFEDAQGNMWITADGQGLGLWEPGSDSLQFFTPPAESRHQDFVRFLCAHPDPEEKGLWLGGANEGLHYFDFGLRAFTQHYFRQKTDRSGLGHNTLLDIGVEADGTVWLASLKGVTRFSPSDSSFSHFLQGDGLPSDAVNALLLDKSGVWIGTKEGLARLDRNSHAIQAYYQRDGLADNNVIYRGIRKYKDQILLCTTHGLNTFSPAELTQTRQAPPVILSGFHVLNEPYALGASPAQVNDIVIRHDDYAFTFYFAAPTAPNPSEVQYAYQLEGLDEDWIEAGNRNFATFTSLPPDDYTFRVKAITLPGQAPGKVLEVKLHIQPAFWQTAWFKMLIGLLVIGLVLAFLWLAKQQLDARHQAELARQSATYKSQFLANMSHEIRTPLHAVLGAADLLADSSLNHQQQHYLHHIRNSGKHLMSLLNDILDFSKIEANKLEFQNRDFSLREVVDYVRETLSHKLREQETTLEVSIPETLPDALHGDPVRLGQILINLINNAITFTPKGLVQLRIWEESKDPEHVQVGFLVRDNGKGIAREEIARIFESFEQGALASQGFGLGLAITKSLVNRQGGTIKVKSAPNKGTAFTFTLPFQLSATENESSLASPDTTVPQGPTIRRILMAEDMPVNRELAADMLRQAYPGVEVVQAGDGAEALEALEAGALPDLILMDIRMPGMDGLECTRKIRQQYGALVPILALSASATREEAERYFRAGIDGLLAKPFSPDQLIEHINRLMSLPDSADLAIDHEGLSHFLGHDEDRIKRYLSSAGEQILNHADALRVNLAEAQWKEAQVAAHSIKTTFSYLGIQPLLKLSTALDTATKEAKPEAFTELIPKLIKGLRALKLEDNKRPVS